MADVVVSDAAATVALVAPAAGTTALYDRHEMTDSGRGSSEEVSYGRISVDASDPLITSSRDSPVSVNERCQLNGT